MDGNNKGADISCINSPMPLRSGERALSVNIGSYSVPSYSSSQPWANSIRPPRLFRILHPAHNTFKNCPEAVTLGSLPATHEPIWRAPSSPAPGFNRRMAIMSCYVCGPCYARAHLTHNKSAYNRLRAGGDFARQPARRVGTHCFRLGPERCTRLIHQFGRGGMR